MGYNGRTLLHPVSRMPKSNPPPKGRGAARNDILRFTAWRREDFDDGWGEDESIAPPATVVQRDAARSIITWNDSPDIPFDRSINPYRGCEHGCAYCYARPSHAYLGLSPGLDFETRLFAKPDAAALLAEELRRPAYRPAPIALGANTDVYQPIERKLRLTRAILDVLAACRHPVYIVTKSALIERDIDLLAEMARQNLVQVIFSVTTLDRALARRLEPRAAAPQRRLQAMRALAEAGIPVGVFFSPVIPALNDAELEAVLAAGRAAGAASAGYVMLRLPHELKTLFQDWLEQHVPLKAAHVMHLVRDLRGGRENSAAFGERMRGAGVYAELIADRFRLACRRLDLNRGRIRLDCSRFQPPARRGDQLALFE